MYSINLKSILNKSPVQDYFLILLLALVCYWPFTAGIFSAKNDNLIVILPFRYNISEAIRAGHLPLWSPYIYLGFPLHGDMQSGCWNPFVWFLSLFKTYDLTLLHIEILIYICFAGLGMYQLLGNFKAGRAIKISGAIAYMMCGFITDVGGSNLLFLASAAFIPFVFNYYYKFLLNQNTGYLLKTAIALSLLFLTGYPSFFILTCYVLLAGLVTFVLRKLKKKSFSIISWRFFGYHILIAFLFSMICLPAIISYLQIMPYYERGIGNISLYQALENSFHPLCSISAILPTAAIKAPTISATTDLITRNLYFNSYFLVFLLFLSGSKKTFLYYFIAIGILFFFLFSLGPYTPVRAWSYRFLPLMNTFRHPSNARLFVIIGCIILASRNAINTFNNEISKRKIRYIILTLLIVLSLLIIYSFYKSNPFHTIVSSFSTGMINRIQLKSILDRLNFYDAIILNGIAQIIFIGLLFYFLKRKNISKRLFVVLCVFNSFVFAQLCIPFTFSGKSSPSEINKALHSFNKNYPIPDLQVSIQESSKDALLDYEKIGIANFYNKKIGMPDIAVTPTFIKALDQFYADSNLRKLVFSYPVAYLTDTIINEDQILKRNPTITVCTSNDHSLSGESFTSTGTLRMSNFSNNVLEFNTNTEHKAFLCVSQVYLPGWNAFIDNKRVVIHQTNKAFMGIVVPAGNHTIKFIYLPGYIYLELIISLLAILLIIGVLLFNKKVNSAPFS